MLVPFGVTTDTLTAPVPAGEVAVMDVPALFTDTPVAGVDPKFTAVAPVRFAPARVTAVPPAAGPLVGLILVRAGEVELVGLVGLVEPDVLPPPRIPRQKTMSSMQPRRQP